MAGVLPKVYLVRQIPILPALFQQLYNSYAFFFNIGNKTPKS